MPNGSGGATLRDAGRDPRRWPLLVAVVLVGLNLRPFLTAVGPLAGGIRTDTGMTLQVLASLTLVPMLLMGVLAFLGPAVEAAVGARRAVVASLALLALGSLLRLVAGSTAGLIG
ncbi:MFS transporter, partial [Rhizorhabdus histidinilytica]